MGMWTLIIRTAIIYFVVFMVMRLMGKREIGKLSVFDLVISVMIAEIAVFVIEDTSKPMLHGILPMATLLLIQVSLAFATLKSRRIRLLFDGRPSFLIEKGKISRHEMKKQRYNLDDLMIQLREKNITNVADVEFAILEPNGKLTVVKKEQSGVMAGQPKFHYEGLPLALIMDGKVQDQHLQKIGKTRFWLKNELQQKGIGDFKDVFFCSIDHRGQMFIDRHR